MTTEPIKPASPLPWKDYGKVVGDASKDPVIYKSDFHASDAAYIVNAANHYPALVEALENLMLAADDMAYHRNPSKAGWDDLSTFVESARSALAAAKGTA